MRTIVRRGLPWLVVPLAIVATGAASAPWLRAFPAAILAAPLFGAAVLSVLVPVVAVRLGVRRLVLTALVDAVAFVLYGLLVVLHSPGGISDLVSGVVHGPAQILSFALPLVSPRTLMVAPVLLCWLTGAVAGECVARRWSSVLPYAAWLIAFGLAYAGTVRATTGGAQHVRGTDTLLAGVFLVSLLLLRAAQTWLGQDAAAESTQADGVLPLRGLGIGLAITAVVALVAAAATQSGAFAGPASAPQRVPAVNRSQPLTPISFIAGLRPSDPASPGRPVFTVRVDQRSSAYFGIANVDFYDGQGWSFSRTFRPSGGVVPADPDPTLNAGSATVTQQYSVDGPALTTAPWMPYLGRPQKITGRAVNVDPTTGMIIPADPLTVGAGYTVRSAAALTGFAALGPGALPATSTPPIDLQVPGPLTATLASLVSSFATETGVAASQPMAYLQALVKDFRSNYALAGGTSDAAPASGAAAASSPARALETHTGGTGFADVLASVLGSARSATPEQFATLFALIARQLRVPARVVTGFRVPAGSGGATLAPGRYPVGTGDAWTWVEIPIRGQGWVVVDPSPEQVGTAAQQSVGAAPSSSASAPPTQNALVTQAAGGHAVAPRSTTPHQRAASSGPWWPWILFGVLALLGLAVVALLTRRRARARRRRRVADPRLGLLGAWHESLDLLTESGMGDPTNLTGTEIASAATRHFGPEPGARVAYLGQAADSVIYSNLTTVRPEDVATAWRTERELRRLVRRALPWPTRVASGLRYHRARPPAQIVGPASWPGADPERGTRRRRH